MIILDINVVSKAMWPEPNHRVIASHGFAVASRDTSAFRAAGIRIIDPWQVTF